MPSEAAPVSEQLERLLEETNLSVSELARRLAADVGGTPKAKRRLIQKWLHGESGDPVVPSAGSVQAIERAAGRPGWFTVSRETQPARTLRDLLEELLSNQRSVGEGVAALAGRVAALERAVSREQRRRKPGTP